MAAGAAAPAVGEPVVVRLPPAAPRAVARRQLRAAAREIISAWSERPPARLELRETSTGPCYAGRIDGASVDLSFSYADGSAWIGLVRGRRIGIDAMGVRDFPEREAVARLYLEPAAFAAMQGSAEPARAFARSWTEFEAMLKCQRRPLAERSTRPRAATACNLRVIRHEPATLLSRSRRPSTDPAVKSARKPRRSAAASPPSNPPSKIPLGTLRPRRRPHRPHRSPPIPTELSTAWTTWANSHRVLPKTNLAP
ncbi:MAG: hypothetical protein ABIZ81_03790 [Opitutaceae bacterium]